MSSDDKNPTGENAPTKAEKKERRLWPLALLLTLLLLGGGGYMAVTGLKDTAHEMGSGSDYDRLAANSAIYSGDSRGDDRSVFAVGEEEDLPGSAAGDTSAGRLNAGIVRSKEELVAAANARGGGSAGGMVYGGEEDGSSVAQGGAPGAASGGSMGSKLKARASLARGKGAARSKGLPAGKSEGFKGSGTVVGKAAVQRETAKGKPRGGNKTGGLEGLKSAFRASFYGARIASNDSAKNWSARAFDAAPEADTAIEYDERVKAKLDRINPNSIPNFLKDMDVSAAEAKRLADSDVSDPRLDKDGTYNSLKEDEDYQSKKLAGDFAGSMINGLFAGISGTGSTNEDGEDEEGPGSKSLTNPEDEEGPGARGFTNPEDEAEFGALALGEYMETAGYGGECGCTPDAPCCCLPQDYFGSDAASQNECPMYGPFLPDDPCGQSFSTDGAVTAGDEYTIPFSGPQ